MADYELRPFPTGRETVIDAGYLGSGRHIVYALGEVDVTRARELLRALSEAEGTKLCFTAFVVASLARAIAADPQVQAYRDWRRRLVLFSDVDVATLIEPRPGAVAVPHILRAANRRTVRDLSQEIRSIQADPHRSAQHGGLVALAPRLPRFVRLLFFWVLKKNPHWFRSMSGTVTVTSVGMFGPRAGWGITFLPLHTLGLTVGGIAPKPGAHEGAIAIREYLHITLGFDHDLVDGAPAARFARVLVDLMESAAVLQDEERLSAPGDRKA